MTNVNEDELSSLLGDSNVVPFKQASKKSDFETLRSEFDNFMRDSNNWYGDFLIAYNITRTEEHYEIRKHICKSLSLTHDVISRHIEFGEIYGRLPINDSELIDILKAHWDVQITYAGVITARIDNLTVSKIEGLQAHINSVVRKYKLPVSAPAIVNELYIWRDAARSKLVTELLNRIKFNPTVDGKAAWQYVLDQHDLDRHSAAYVEGVYKKFIWAVKRKTAGLPVTFHQMPIVMGAQGTGKTFFISNHLCAPLEGFILPTDFSSITETRNAEQWEYPILFSDEMAFASRADVDAVKNRITAPTITYRPMASNSNAVVTNKVTFIGATNKTDLAEMIRDETGNRRFAPIYFNEIPGNQRTNPSEDMMLALWQSVDENGPDPSAAIKEELAKIQKEQRFFGPVEQFLTDFETERTDSKYPFKDLWEHYRTWKFEAGSNCKMSRNDFYKKLRSIVTQNVKTYKIVNTGRTEFIRFAESIETNDEIDPRVKKILGKA